MDLCGHGKPDMELTEGMRSGRDIPYKPALVLSLNLFNHMVLAFLTLAIIFVCARMKFVKTAFHATLCTLGFIFIMGEAVMTSNDNNFFLWGMKHSRRYDIHWKLQLIGGVLGILGTLQKSIAKERHFHTMHGKIGLAAIVFFLINALLGALGVYSDTYRHCLKAKTMRVLHANIGSLTFLLMIVTQIYGYNTGFFRRNFDKIDAYKGLTLIVGILTIFTPFKDCVLETVHFIRTAAESFF